MDERPRCWVCKCEIRWEACEDWERRSARQWPEWIVRQCNARLCVSCGSLRQDTHWEHETERVALARLDAECKDASIVYDGSRFVHAIYARWHGTYDNPEIAVALALPQWKLEHRSPRDEHGGEWWLLARRD